MMIPNRIVKINTGRVDDSEGRKQLLVGEVPEDPKLSPSSRNLAEEQKRSKLPRPQQSYCSGRQHITGKDQETDLEQIIW